MSEFTPFPKVPRWFRDVTITEKIDGTNGVIYIRREPVDEPSSFVGVHTDPDGSQYGQYVMVSAGSRNQWISPEKDNFGFAKWVHANALGLAESLGEGLHYGEWWGPGIQRGYGLKQRRFSLFNTARWADQVFSGVEGLGVVPILYQGKLTPLCVYEALEDLDETGSVASPGFMRPEGIVIWHHAGRQLYKVTLENDASPKQVIQDDRSPARSLARAA